MNLYSTSATGRSAIPSSINSAIQPKIFIITVIPSSCIFLHVVLNYLLIYGPLRNSSTSQNHPSMKGLTFRSGGNLGGAGGGGGDRNFRKFPPPPHLYGKLTNFRKFCPKTGLKTVFLSANRGGGVCRKFVSFVENLGGFAPPPPEKVNFRHSLFAYLSRHK